MTSKVSRAALIAAIAVGASGLVAGSAQAADTPYYVNEPAVTGVTQLTPESVTLNGSVDTGGDPGITYTFPTGTTGSLPFGGGIIIPASTAGDEISIDGLPVSGSDSDVALVAGSAKVNSLLVGTPADEYSNDGNDNYSDVVFEYDTVKDYIANGDTFGPDTQYAPEIDLPTAAVPYSNVKVSVGAFGTAAQNSTGNTPLTPNTEYVYGITDQPGVTDNAVDVNTTPTASAATYSCYPTAYLASLPSGNAITTDPQQGPCIYIYGNVLGTDYYNSVAGTFKTPALGKLVISKTAVVKGNGATITVDNTSAFKDTGELQLTTNAGRVLASAKLSIGGSDARTVKLTLTAAGKKAAAKKDSEKLVLTSNFGQTTTTKRVTL